MSRSTRLVPVIVASPLFLQNLDSSVMATALPSIAQSLAVPVLHLNLAITAYLLSLAVFLPLSGWLADRYGAKRVFCAAIALFALASALCASATGLPSMVAFRILQGLGGAMMVPVGRLILLRAIPSGEMVSAMVWFTVPPVLGRMVGPLFGGAIVTFTTWHWIFLVNIPFGLLAIAMAWAYIPDESGPARVPVHFDGWGFLLMAAGLGLLMTAIETAGKAMAPVWLSVLAAGTGIACLLAYYRHSRNMAYPLIDLGILRWRTFRTNVLGAAPLRFAIGAMPFLLPLLFQLGFGMSPLQSGLLTMASAIGALATRLVMKRAIIDFGFRRLLLGACGVTGLSYMGYSLWGPHTPQLVVFAALMVGGLVSSLCMVALGTLGFSEIPKLRMSHATALSTMLQQLSVSFGVVLGASLLSAVSWWHGGDGHHLQSRDFMPVFVIVGLLTLLSLLSFRRLPANAGADMREAAGG